MIGNSVDLPETEHLSAPPPAFVEDVEILAEIARGDLGRFDVLVNRYKVRLMSYLGHRVPDRHQAEDLVQEAFLRLFRAARNGGYSGRAGVSTWLFTIADNCTTDYLRAAGRQPLTLESDTAGISGHDRQACSIAVARPTSIRRKRPHVAKAKAGRTPCCSVCPRNSAAWWP